MNSNVTDQAGGCAGRHVNLLLTFDISVFPWSGFHVIHISEDRCAFIIKFASYECMQH